MNWVVTDVLNETEKICVGGKLWVVWRNREMGPRAVRSLPPFSRVNKPLLASLIAPPRTSRTTLSSWISASVATLRSQDMFQGEADSWSGRVVTVGCQPAAAFCQGFQLLAHLLVRSGSGAMPHLISSLNYGGPGAWRGPAPERPPLLGDGVFAVMYPTTTTIPRHRDPAERPICSPRLCPRNHRFRGSSFFLSGSEPIFGFSVGASVCHEFYHSKRDSQEALSNSKLLSTEQVSLKKGKRRSRQGSEKI